MRKLPIPFLVALFFLVSCKKENKTCDLNASNITGSYKVTAYTYQPDASSPPEDFLATTETCKRDDVLTFNDNGTTTHTDAGVKCFPSQDDTGAWSLNGDVLTVDGDALTISTFNCSTMVLTQTGLPGETINVTFIRQ